MEEAVPNNIHLTKTVPILQRARSALLIFGNGLDKTMIFGGERTP
jgi:hypothetical protein